MNINCRSNQNQQQIDNNAQAIIYLLRHGELEQKGILCGHTDILLSKTGWQQLEEKTKKLKGINLCFSSPLLRCQNFSQQWTNPHHIPLTIDSRLKEMNFGDWDGKSYDFLWSQTKNKPENIENTVSANTCTNIGEFWKNPWIRPIPNGEAMEGFCQRVDNFWQELLIQTKNKNSLVISHGGVIKHILARVLNMPIPGNIHFNTFTIPYASLIKINVFYDDNGDIWPSIEF